MAVFSRVHMPSLDGATGWLNTEPLGPAELRGHVVVVNFWTLTCINWLRQEPYVRAWSRAYQGAIGRLPGCRRQRLRDPERLRQPLLAGAVLPRRGRTHQRPPLRRRTQRGIRARHPAPARRRPGTRVRRRARRGGGGRLGPLVYARDLPWLRARRALRVTRPVAPQPLGARRRMDDRGRERRARPARRKHRVPLPRARRASRAVSRNARADPLQVLIDGEAPGPSH